MCCEISHKVLRTDTVLDQMGEVFQKTKGGPGFRADVEKALLGAIIITRWLRRIYEVRVLRICFPLHLKAFLTVPPGTITRPTGSTRSPGTRSRLTSSRGRTGRS